MEAVIGYEVIDEDLAHVFYSGTDKQEANLMKEIIEAMGHVAKLKETK